MARYTRAGPFELSGTVLPACPEIVDADPVPTVWITVIMLGMKVLLKKISSVLITISWRHEATPACFDA